MKGNGPLVLGVVLLSVILTAVTWLFFLSPAEDARAAAVEAAASQREFNAGLEAQIAELEAKSALLPQWREQIHEVRREFPPRQDIPAVRESLIEVFEDNGLLIFNDSFGVPTPVVPATSLATAAEAAGVTSQVDGRSFDGLLAVPVSFQTAGSYEATMTLLDDLQYGDHIMFLVSQVQATPYAGGATASGGVEVAAGDLLTQVTLYFFVLDYGKEGISLPPVEPELDEDGNPIIEEPEEPELDEDGNPVEPDPYDKRNPFVPVGSAGSSSAAAI